MNPGEIVSLIEDAGGMQAVRVALATALAQLSEDMQRQVAVAVVNPQAVRP